MATVSAYYDTCIFLESLNPTHDECPHCVDLLDTAKVRWKIALCRELSISESTAREFIERFEVDCALNGVNITSVTTAEARKIAKKNRDLGRSLKQLGFGSNDWTHVAAAAAAGVNCLCTVDSDFLDPANKSTPKAKRKKTRVKDAIEERFPIRVRLPSEFLQNEGNGN